MCLYFEYYMCASICFVAIQNAVVLACSVTIMCSCFYLPFAYSFLPINMLRNGDRFINDTSNNDNNDNKPQLVVCY